jgi:hypothetical protein
MIQATEAFLSGNITLADTVKILESSLNAAELANRKLEQEFYRNWGPLEELHACSVELGTPVDDEATRRSVEAMRSFLVGAIDRLNGGDATETENHK